MIKPYQYDFFKEYYIDADKSIFFSHSHDIETLYNAYTEVRKEDGKLHAWAKLAEMDLRFDEDISEPSDEEIKDKMQEFYQEILDQFGVNTKDELERIITNAYILSAMEIKNHKIVNIYNILLDYQYLSRQPTSGWGAQNCNGSYFYHNGFIPTTIQRPLTSSGKGVRRTSTSSSLERLVSR